MSARRASLLLAVAVVAASALPARASADSAPVFTRASPPLDVYQAGTVTRGSNGGSQSPGFSYGFAASGSPAPTFSASGLPAGVTIDPSTGTLIGAPTDPGPFSFTVSAVNGTAPAASAGPFVGYTYADNTSEGFDACPRSGGYQPNPGGETTITASTDETDTGVTAANTLGPATITTGDDHGCKFYVTPGQLDININTGRVCPAGQSTAHPGLCTLTVAPAGSGTGSVSSSDGQVHCGTTCSHLYQSDTPVSITLTAIPAAGSTFTGFSGGGCSGTSPNCTVTLADDSPTVTATFAVASSAMPVSTDTSTPAASTPPASTSTSSPPATSKPAVPTASHPASASKPLAVSSSEALTALPSAKTCVSRRAFKIHLRAPAGAAVKQAIVSVSGKRVAMRSGSKLSSAVDLRGYVKGTFKVKITLLLTGGARVSATRTYHTCTRKHHRS